MNYIKVFLFLFLIMISSITNISYWQQYKQKFSHIAKSSSPLKLNYISNKTDEKDNGNTNSNQYDKQDSAAVLGRLLSRVLILLAELALIYFILKGLFKLFKSIFH